ncbi:MAG: heme-binding protein [Dehalococcoidia bacterium]|nr:heme-binding protein [Dehalococcoidia bacterium]
MAGTFTKKSITQEAARAIIVAAEAKAKQKGMAMAIAIVDAEGALKAFSRMDGCGLLSVQVSQDKAWTSISIGGSGLDFWNMIKGDDMLKTYVPQIPRMAAVGGGLPIRTKAGELVGGIGVSGGSADDDNEVAKAALTVFAE